MYRSRNIYAKTSQSLHPPRARLLLQCLLTLFARTKHEPPKTPPRPIEYQHPYQHPDTKLDWVQLAFVPYSLKMPFRPEHRLSEIVLSGVLGAFRSPELVEPCPVSPHLLEDVSTALIFIHVRHADVVDGLVVLLQFRVSGSGGGGGVE